MEQQLQLLIEQNKALSEQNGRLFAQNKVLNEQNQTLKSIFYQGLKGITAQLEQKLGCGQKSK